MEAAKTSAEQVVKDELGSGLIDQSHQMTAAAMQMADMKV